MKILNVIIVLVITISTSLYGQDKEGTLPNTFFGDWVETPNQCEVSPLLSISMENNKLIVYGYEWYSHETKVDKKDDYFTLILKGYSEGEEFESEINIKKGENDDLIIINSELEETRLIRCENQGI
ncbi:MAG: hypothetical protein HWE07_02590 [Cytophagia bacterium]|nr:hypothetical protein [Cytophagia bacterium]